MASKNSVAKMSGVFIWCVFLNLYVFTFAEQVPVYLMGLKSPSNYPSVSAFGTVSHKEFRAKYLDQLTKDHKNIVAFVQDRLSAEDLSKHGKSLAAKEVFPHLESNLKKNPSLVLPNVENPIEGLRSLKNTMQVREIHSNSKDKLHSESLKPEVLIYHLPATLEADDKKEALRKNDKIIHNVMKDLKASNKEFVAMYTGLKPSYDSNSEMEMHYRIARQLNADYSLDVSDNFLNYTKFFLYGNNVTISVNSIESKISESVNLVWPPEKVTGPEIDANNTEITFTFGYDKAENLSNIELIIKFTNASASGFWEAKDIQFSAKFEQEPRFDALMPFQLKAKYNVGASKGFSFSCGKLEMSRSFKNVTDKLDLSITFAIHHFQAEWFPKHDYFSESFDCYTFFTIPIWMGLFVVILFTTILAVGIFMLFEVKTMDRFDDPKGKSISVPLAD